MTLKILGGPEDLSAALAELGLTAPATWKQVKAAYRQKSRELHPDRNASAGATESMARLNAAYSKLRDYVEGFRFRFSDAEFLEQNPRERVRRQFAQADPGSDKNF